MPIGVHRIPETSVYVSGHQGAAGIGALFGPIGLAAAHAAAQSTGEKKPGDPAALRIDIAAEADRVLKVELDRRLDVVRSVDRSLKTGIDVGGRRRHRLRRHQHRRAGHAHDHGIRPGAVGHGARPAFLGGAAVPALW